MTENIRTSSYIIAAIIILIGLGLLIAFGLPGTAEAKIGAIIILLVGVIFTLMFVLSAGFNRLNLSDAQQALGLPEGSIRALIAIFLIVVFVGVGIYIFRSVAYPLVTTTLPGLTTGQVAELATENIITQVEASEEDPETFNVIIRSDITQEGMQLGQQVISVLGTLVVAVAGFYFGARAVSAAQGVTTAVSEPVIRTVEPYEGEQGSESQLVILGKNFATPQTVKLVKQSASDIVCDNILSNATKISCKLKLDAQAPIGKWHLVVINADNSQDQLDDAFEVLAKSAD